MCDGDTTQEAINKLNVKRYGNRAQIQQKRSVLNSKHLSVYELVNFDQFRQPLSPT